MSKDKSKQQDKPKQGGKSKDKAPKDKAPKDKASKDKGQKQQGNGEEKPAVPPRLKQRYFNELLPQMVESLGRKNRLAVPRLEKIVVNMGVGSAITEKKHLEEAVSAMTQITGQKPSVRRARKSIAGFRLREGMEIGCMVTLRGDRMYEFLDRLISLALPRVRDFRGLSPKAFDGNGNYSLGLSEQLVFPELDPDRFSRPQGMNVTLVISGGSDEESRELLRGFGMPFRT